ncbi:hypothetical protein ACIBVL_29030 [Streptomyces sp. NPDC049687]|uniref:hypothetical protein n=1 Tax=Streptomyces sp. NPDC049687 TaxID=3365596 RepID=UPI00378910C6
MCAGFLYGLGVAQGLIAADTADSVLVIGTDALSLSVAPDDPTSMLFGDGAGAVVLRSGHREESGALGPCVLGSDGGGRDLITVRGGGSEGAVRGRRRHGGPPSAPGGAGGSHRSVRFRRTAPQRATVRRHTYARPLPPRPHRHRGRFPGTPWKGVAGPLSIRPRPVRRHDVRRLATR